MDPDANLAEQLKLAQRIQEQENFPDEMSKAQLAQYDQDTQRLAELVYALNSWIVQGGTLPTTWQKKENS